MIRLNRLLTAAPHTHRSPHPRPPHLRRVACRRTTISDRTPAYKRRSTTIVINQGSILTKQDWDNLYACPPPTHAPLVCALAACGGTSPEEGATRVVRLIRTTLVRLPPPRTTLTFDFPNSLPIYLCANRVRHQPYTPALISAQRNLSRVPALLCLASRCCGRVSLLPDKWSSTPSCRLQIPCWLVDIRLVSTYEAGQCI